MRGQPTAPKWTGSDPATFTKQTCSDEFGLCLRHPDTWTIEETSRQLAFVNAAGQTVYTLYLGPTENGAWQCTDSERRHQVVLGANQTKIDGGGLGGPMGTVSVSRAVIENLKGGFEARVFLTREAEYSAEQDVQACFHWSNMFLSSKAYLMILSGPLAESGPQFSTATEARAKLDTPDMITAYSILGTVTYKQS